MELQAREGGLLDAAPPGDTGGQDSVEAAVQDGAPNADPRDAQPEEGPKLLIQVATGALQGKVQYDTRLFLAVPYAAPPVDELRFAPPTAPVPWSGVRDATTAGPSCIQPADGTDGPTSEDCLTLDVYAPLQVGMPRPVMVFLHGGAFSGGGAHTFAAQWLSAPHDVIVVNVNYRLGALGFVVDPALDAALGVPSGNLGLRDQQQALRWLRDNVAAFGGDPQRITLFGQSAGAISTCLHLFAHGSEGLFQRALMQSGTCIESAGAPLTRAQIIERSAPYTQLRCPDAATRLNCLRSLPASSFRALSIAEDLLVTGFYPHVDGVLIRKPPRELLSEGQLHAEQLLLGTNLREFDLPKTKGSPLPSIPDQLTLTLLITSAFPEDAETLLKLYGGGSDAEAHAAYVRFTVDKDQRCPARTLARAAAALGHTTYLYSFEVAPAVHSMELDYVFGWPEGGVSATLTGAPNPPLPNLVSAMQGYWTRFAARGDPNGPGAPAWQAWSVNGSYQELGATARSGTALYGAECDFWDVYFARGTGSD